AELALQHRLRVRADLRSVVVVVDHLLEDAARLGRRTPCLLLRAPPRFLFTPPCFLFRTPPLLLRAPRGLVVHLLRRLRRRLPPRARSQRHHGDQHGRQDQTPLHHRISSV